VSEEDSLKVRQENPLARKDWNQRLQSYPHSSFFHTAEWADVLQQTYGFTPCYQVVAKEDQMLAMMPLMEVKSWLTGCRGISLPFTDECEPLGCSRDALNATVESALGQARSRGWKYLETRGGSMLPARFSNAIPSMTFFTHHLRLEPGLDDLFGSFESSVRRAIRRAEKAGLEIEVSTDASAMENYYVLHCKTRREHGLPPQPFRFFQNIQTRILARSMGIIISAKHGSRTVASAIFLMFGREAIYKFGASDPAFQHLRANNLVMWKAIQWCVGKGAKVLNFGRTSLSNEGLRRFKRGWGAEENELHYYKYDLRKNSFVKASDATEGWHTWAFHTMPFFASRFAGAFLYRHAA
jgi:hypothetical protein